jgi:hypothetical protein
MFQFAGIVVANDISIGPLRWLAGMHGMEGADWTWEWRAGGRASFNFRDESKMETFRANRLLLDDFWHKRAAHCRGGNRPSP